MPKWQSARRMGQGVQDMLIFTPCSMLLAPCYLFSLAHVSFRLTVRLNTRLPGLLSLSTQKYPILWNWNFSSGSAVARDGSILHPVSMVSESGFRNSLASLSLWPEGSSSLKSLSYSLTSASIACSAETQCSVPLTLRSASGPPLRVSGS